MTDRASLPDVKIQALLLMSLSRIHILLFEAPSSSVSFFDVCLGWPGITSERDQMTAFKSRQPFHLVVRLAGCQQCLLLIIKTLPEPVEQRIMTLCGFATHLWELGMALSFVVFFACCASGGAMNEPAQYVLCLTIDDRKSTVLLVTGQLTDLLWSCSFSLTIVFGSFSLKGIVLLPPSSGRDISPATYIPIIPLPNLGHLKASHGIQTTTFRYYPWRGLIVEYKFHEVALIKIYWDFTSFQMDNTKLQNAQDSSRVRIYRTWLL